MSMESKKVYENTLQLKQSAAMNHQQMMLIVVAEFHRYLLIYYNVFLHFGHQISIQRVTI